MNDRGTIDSMDIVITMTRLKVNISYQCYVFLIIVVKELFVYLEFIATI